MDDAFIGGQLSKIYFFDLIKEAKVSLKKDGFATTLKQYSWKFLFFIFLFYLVRDICLYIVLPKMALYMFQVAGV